MISMLIISTIKAKPLNPLDQQLLRQITTNLIIGQNYTNYTV